MAVVCLLSHLSFMLTCCCLGIRHQARRASPSAWVSLQWLVKIDFTWSSCLRCFSQQKSQLCFIRLNSCCLSAVRNPYNLSHLSMLGINNHPRNHHQPLRLEASFMQSRWLSAWYYLSYWFCSKAFCARAGDLEHWAWMLLLTDRRQWLSLALLALLHSCIGVAVCVLCAHQDYLSVTSPFKCSLLWEGQDKP